MFESSKQLIYKELNKNRGKKHRETIVNWSTRTQSLYSKSGHFGGVGSILSTPTKFYISYKNIF